MTYNWIPYLLLNLAGLVILHLSIVTGQGKASGTPTTFAVLVGYIKAREVNLLMSLIISGVVFYLAWSGSLSFLGWGGGESVRGGYVMSGFLSEYLWDEVADRLKTKAKEPPPPPLP